jgi:hypothetical protein
LAGAPVTLAGPVSFGCPEGVVGARCALVDVAAPPPAVTWPAVGSTACGWAVGTVAVGVEEALLADDVAECVCVDFAAPEGDGAVPEGCCALEPHPATSTTTAIAVSPAARMG